MWICEKGERRARATQRLEWLVDHYNVSRSQKIECYRVHHF